MIEAIEVNKNNSEHIKELYNLIKSKTFNISHENIPTFNEHKKFVKSTQYRKWYLILKSSNCIGSYYLTQDNVIGLNLLSNDYIEYVEIIKHIINDHKPLPPISSLRSKYFLINANPNNINLIKALKSLDMEHIQDTYAYKV